MYCVYQGESNYMPYSLAGHHKATFPEIANAISIRQIPPGQKVSVDKVEYPAEFIRIDSAFFGMFGVKIIEGSMDFLIPQNGKIAITDVKARQMFGNESPIGRTLDDGDVICAVVTGLSKHSNYPFDFLTDISTMPGTVNHTLVELLPGVDVEAFRKKLHEHTVQIEHWNLSKISLMPITDMHYKDPNVERYVKFEHIILFSVAGSLLILCTLFNYLSLFVSRFRMRQREFALRIVYGASNRSLFTLLSVEFLVAMFVALLLGLALVETVVSSFVEISGVRLALSSIYFEMLAYIAGIILFALLTFVLTLAVFRRRTLNASIRSGNKRLFRKVAIVSQLVISIGFMFCTIVIVKQMYYLHNTDLGFEFKNRGYVDFYGVDADVLDSKLQQIPEITETLKSQIALVPPARWWNGYVTEWDEKPENAKQVNFSINAISKQYCAHYNIKLVEGEMLNDGDDKNLVVINESAAKALGWNNAVGKSFGEYRVKGVIGNIYNAAPTISVTPAVYVHANIVEKQLVKMGEQMPAILFKYRDGAWKSCCDKIEKIMETVGKESSRSYIGVLNEEEVYDTYLKSENILLRILTLISVVCAIVCVFGFVSMVTLTCEERRKEIAIRKIHGATIKDILDIFFKEYLLLLIVGALIAFPVGYIIMKRWLENYVVQTEMSAWIYAAILLALIMAIVLCVGRKVYRTSRENPAEAVKKF
jgi:hypothetical protein